MKLMIASDIHGSLTYCNKMKEAYEREGAMRLLLLGDLLYHGPRNDLPRDYNPKGVIQALNAMKEELLCVRGNCDAEVDQMVLDFPILSDSLLLFLEGRTVFATHGHIYHEGSLPKLKKGDILLHGHTHLMAAEDRGDYVYLNPGSISLPKGKDENSYMTYEDGVFFVKALDGRILKKYTL